VDRETPLKALVTGAGRAGGIGQSIVARLEAAGMEVVTLDREPGGTYQADVVSDDLPDLSDIDVYVANAALTTMLGAAHTFKLERWKQDVAVNLTGNLRVLQSVLPGMRKRRFGRIVVVSSIAAVSGMPAQVSYSATKSALQGFVKTVAAENISFGITANAVLPSMTATSAVLSMPQDIIAAWVAAIPNGLVEPAAVASAVNYFASPTAARVTGQSLIVDGGAALNRRSVTSSAVGRTDSS
jgi:NAD(P)-dependent dehydrogenase (short-subunit alcohol dehydrogenase family)